MTRVLFRYSIIIGLSVLIQSGAALGYETAPAPFGVDENDEVIEKSARTDSYPGLNFSQADLYILRHRLDFFRSQYLGFRSAMNAHLQMLQNSSPYSDRVDLKSLGPLYSGDYEKIIEISEIDDSDEATGFLIKEAKSRFNRENLVKNGMEAAVGRMLEVAGGISFVLDPLSDVWQEANFLATVTLGGLNAMMDNFYSGIATEMLFKSWSSAGGERIFNPNIPLEEEGDKTAQIIAKLDNVIDAIESDDETTPFSYTAQIATNRWARDTLVSRLNGQGGLLDTLKQYADITSVGSGVSYQWMLEALGQVLPDGTSVLEYYPRDADGNKIDVDGNGRKDSIDMELAGAWNMEIDSLIATVELHKNLIDEYTLPRIETLVFVDPSPDSSEDRYPVTEFEEVPVSTYELPAEPDWTVGTSGCDFTNIQAAVDIAAPGDAIQIQAKGEGAYYEESVVIDKQGLILYADDINTAFIGKPGTKAPLLYGVKVCADNVRLYNLMIQRAGKGLVIENAKGVVAKNNMIQWTLYGIIIDGGFDCTIAGNLVANACARAVHIERGGGNALYYNKFILESGVTNTACAYDSGDNTWDDDADTGNYWSDYAGDGTIPYTITNGSEKDDRVYGDTGVTPGETLILKALVGGVFGSDTVSVDFFFGNPDGDGVSINGTNNIEARIQGNYAVASYQWDTMRYCGAQDIYAVLSGSRAGVSEKVRISGTPIESVTGGAYYATSLTVDAGDTLLFEGDYTADKFCELYWIDSPYDSPSITIGEGGMLQLSGVFIEPDEHNWLVGRNQRSHCDIYLADNARMSAEGTLWNANLTVHYEEGAIEIKPWDLVTGWSDIGVGESVLVHFPITRLEFLPGSITLEGCYDIGFHELNLPEAGLEIKNFMGKENGLDINAVTVDSLSINECYYAFNYPSYYEENNRIRHSDINDIVLTKSGPTRILYNTIGTLNVESGSGVDLVKGNTFTGLQTQIHLCNDDYYDIIKNTFTGCEVFAINGSPVANYYDISINDNTFEDCGGCYYLNTTAGRSDGNLRFKNNRVINHSLADVQGILVESDTPEKSMNLDIQGNELIYTAQQTNKAINLRNIKIHSGGIFNNTFDSVGFGIYLEGCHSVESFLNRFLNGSTAYDDATGEVNQWYTGTTGNYWEGFDGTRPNYENYRAWALPYTNAVGVVDVYPLIEEAYFEKAPHVNGAAPVPATGATEAYDEEGNIITSGNGQDGDVQAGVPWPEPRFELRKGGAVVLDRMTGLMWCSQGNVIAQETPGFDSDGRVTWERGLEYIAAVNDNIYADIGAGFHDWRLPNIKELLILHQVKSESIAVFLNNHSFTNVIDEEYWSSTKFDWFYDTESVWTLDFGGPGNTAPLKKTSTACVLMVRNYGPVGGYPVSIRKTGQTESFAADDDGALQMGISTPAPRWVFPQDIKEWGYTQNGGYWLYTNDIYRVDMLTGLIWGPRYWVEDVYDIDEDHGWIFLEGTWQECLDHVEKLNNGTYGTGQALGYTDWRLPNMQEILTLFEYNYADVRSGDSRYEAALEGSDMTLDRVWTSTTVPSDSSKAYTYNFENGRLQAYDKGLTCTLLTVRGESFRQQEDNTELSASPESVSFGAIDCMDNSATEITIDNSGENPAKLIAVYLAGRDQDSFYLRGAPLANSLVPGGGAVAFDVVFRPESGGFKEAWAVIYANALNNRQVIRLTGTSVLHSVNVNIEDQIGGSVEAYSSFDNETVSVSGGETLEFIPDDDIEFTIIPSTGYVIADVLVDDASIGAVDSYIFDNISASHTLDVRFQAVQAQTYDIAVTVSGNGGVLPTGNQTVDYGDPLRLVFTPDDENRVAEVLVDGVSVGSPDFFQFDNVTENHGVSVTFESIAGEKAGVAATGQTISYAAGDDGGLQRGVAWPDSRFVDNGDGTITDKLTGLMWLKHASLSTQDNWSQQWEEALMAVEGFNNDPAAFAREGYTAAYEDWRLPNIVELSSLFCNAGAADIKSWLENEGFVNVPAARFWSSTSLPSGSKAFVADMVYGYLGFKPMDKESMLFTWPVRGTAAGRINLPETGQASSIAADDDGDLKRGLAWPSPRFTDNGDGTITDELTGLMVLEVASVETNQWLHSFTWSGALDYIAALNSGDNSGMALYDDWRLPNLTETMSLINWAQARPEAVDYWTSTTNPKFTNQAYLVEFSPTPAIYPRSKNEACRILAVRDTLQEAPMSDYESWAEERLAGFAEEQRGFGDDPDGDGAANLLEYACGCDPDAADAGRNRLRFGESSSDPTNGTVYLRSDDSKIRYALRVSDDLQNWRDIGLEYEDGGWTMSTGNLEILSAAEVGDSVWRIVFHNPTDDNQVFVYLEVVYISD